MNALTFPSLKLASAAQGAMRRFASAALVALLAFAGSARLMAAGNTPQQVVVTNPVEVLGSVEVVGEPFKQPFAVQKDVSVNAGPLNTIITVPLPAGKRMVIESISVNAWMPAGAKPVGWVSLNPKTGFTNGGSSGLQFQEQGAISGATLFTSVTPAVMRLNTDQQYLQVNVYRINSLAAFQCTVSVFGYIESL